MPDADRPAPLSPEQEARLRRDPSDAGWAYWMPHIWATLDAERAARDGGGLREDRDRWRDEAYYQYRLRMADPDRPVTDLGDLDPFARLSGAAPREGGA